METLNRDSITVEHAEEIETILDNLEAVASQLCSSCNAPTWELSRMNASEALKRVYAVMREVREGREWLQGEE